MRRISLLLALVASLFVTPALADFTGKNASLATITFKNPGDCTAVICVPVFQLYDGTNLAALTTVGADGVSNTLTGLPTYDRMHIFNGTTWDRWQGAIKAAANAYAAGSLAIGAGVDGWNITEGVTTDAASTAGGTGTQSAKLRLMTTQLNSLALNQSSQITQETTTATNTGTTNTNLGAQADAAAAADNSSASLISLLKRTNQNLTTVNTTAAAATPAGSNLIGKVGIDQTTPGTTNLVALAANQSVNVAQFGGVSTATGQVAVSTAPVTATNTALVTALRPDSPGIIALGQTTKSASVPVAIASDQVGTAGTAAANVLTVQGISSMTKLLVTPDSVALPANQSVNTAQVNGVTTLTGTGIAGTGTQRVTLSNTDPCASPDIAKSSAIINITTAATTALVPVSGATVTYVCGFTFTISQVVTTPNTLVFENGTGTACATGPTALTGLYGGGGVTAAAPIVISSQADRTIFKTPASNGLCALTAIGATGSFQGVLTYVQQ